MIVKPYADENLRGLTRLMNQWSEQIQWTEIEIEDSIKTAKQKSDGCLFLAEDRVGDITGYIFMGIIYQPGWKPYAEIIQLLVDGNRRGQGIGKLLIEHVCNYYSTMGLKEIRLHSSSWREEAHCFYERQGFKEFKQSKFFAKKLSE